MSLINNQYYSIPEEVWWYKQAWCYASRHKTINGKIYVYIITNISKTCYIPFSIENPPIEIIIVAK